MIQRATGPVGYGSARAWRVLMESAMDEDTFKAIFTNLFRRAKDNTYAAIVVRDTLVGKPRPAPVEVEPIDLGDLTTIKGCIDAMAGLAQAQNLGQVNEQTAEHLRATISVAMQGMRLVQEQNDLDDLMSQGSVPDYLTPEEHEQFMEIREGGLNRG